MNLPELASLRRERDPELRGEGLLALARQLARGENLASAAELYAELGRDELLPTSVRERAQAQLSALRGETASSEVFLSRFFQQATDPANLFAMTAAGSAFRAVHWLALGRLAASPVANSFTRGLGARALAGLAGFGVEATAFPLAARLGNLALGRETSWTLPLLGRETASSFLMLGALRAGGLVSGSLALRASLFRPAIQQAGMFGGILLGQELEARAGLRERRSGSTALVDSLSTLLVFNVAGRLSRHLVGESLRRWEIRTETQSQALTRNFSDFFGPRPSPALVPAGPGPALGRTSELPRLDILLMAGRDGSGPPRPPRGGKVVSLEEYRRRHAAPSPAEDAPRPQDSEPTPASARPNLSMSRQEWLSQLRSAMVVFLAEAPSDPDREFRILRDRLASHSDELVATLGYLSIRRPIAAQLLALRRNLVREDSFLQFLVQGHEATRPRVRERFEDPQQRAALFRELLERHAQSARSRGYQIQESALDTPAAREAFNRLPAELVEAAVDPLLTEGQFLELSWGLGIFARP